MSRVGPSGGASGEDSGGASGEGGSDADGGTGVDAGGEGGRAAGGVPGAAGESVGGKPAGGEGGEAYAGSPFVGGAGGEVSEGGAPAEFGGLTVTTTPERQDFDLFDPAGHTIWLEVSDSQREFMNTAQTGGNPDPWGDFYTPAPAVTYVDHLLVQEVEGLSVADYGKTAVRLGAGVSFRQWTEESIPNLGIDVTVFEQALTLGGFERFELHNALAGGIYREVVGQRVLRALGVPSLRTSFAFLGSNVWGESAWVPMVVVQSYDERYCEEQAAELGGECENIWYAPGTQGGDFSNPPTCLLESCDEDRLSEFSDALDETPEGPGFAEALSEFVDWPRFYDFQCATFLLDTQRDSVIVVERDDGRFVFAAHSLDTSSGNVQTSGFFKSDRLFRGCHADPECRAGLLEACGAMVTAFDQLNPHRIVEAVRDAVDALRMRRSGDVERAAELREWYRVRQPESAEELALYSGPLGPDGCPEVLEMCVDGTCGTPEQCQARQCGDGPLVWCSAYQSCIYYWDYCPSCSESSPFYCNVNGSCLASQDECAALCSEEYPYCPQTNNCEYWCDGGMGGRPGVGGAAGFAGSIVMPGTGGTFATGGVPGTGGMPATGGIPGAGGGVGVGGAATSGSAGVPGDGGVGAVDNPG